MSNSQVDVVNFTSIDETEEANWYIDFMDYANSLKGYKEIRDAIKIGFKDLTGKTILDVGCGTGSDTIELANFIGQDTTVIGIDISQSMIDVAQSRNLKENVTFKLGDISSLPFDDSVFDAVRVKLVRQHCGHLLQADNEIVRVMKSGATLAVFDYDFDTMIINYPDRNVTREIVKCFADGHKNPDNGRFLKSAFVKAGISVISIVPIVVEWPLELLYRSLNGRISVAIEEQQIDLTREDVNNWWKVLRALDSLDDFFCTVTGFILFGEKQ